MLFDDDSDNHLLRCELTGSTTDLHLIVYGDGNGTVVKLVAPEPRFLLQKITTLSVPLTALTLGALDILEGTHKVRAGSSAAKSLRHWLRQDLGGWQKLQKEMGKTQQALNLGPMPDELPLSDSN